MSAYSPETMARLELIRRANANLIFYREALRQLNVGWASYPPTMTKTVYKAERARYLARIRYWNDKLFHIYTHDFRR